MTKSARSVGVFSIYLFVLGAVLVLIPNVLLSIFMIPSTNEVWIRVVGMLVVLLGFYYFQASKNDMMRNFFQWTVYARLSVPVFFIIFVLFGLAPPMLILFGIVDAAAAIWTHISLSSEKQGS